MSKRILVLAPHTDDAEIGCGGTIAKYIEQGHEVFYLVFSAAEESVPAGFPKDTLRYEVMLAASELGVKKENIALFSYKVRYFTYSRQDILEDMVKFKKEIAPDLVLLPSRNDIHQDHYTITTEGIRAYKSSSILGYELPWNNLSFQSHCFNSLEEVHLQKKIDAINCYKTQQGRQYTNPEFIKSWAIMRGTQSQNKLAESFEVIKWNL